MAQTNGKNGAHPAEPIEGIDRITIAGFKSIAKETAIDIKPLTILAGANSSGKSSIMQPLLLLKQTLEASYDAGALRIDGPNAKFSLADQLFSRYNPKTSQEIKIGIKHARLIIATSYVYNSSSRLFDVEKMTLTDNLNTIVFWPGMSHEEYIIACPPRNKYDEELVHDFVFQTVRSKSFVAVQAIMKKDVGTNGYQSFPGRSISMVPPLETALQGIIHVPSLRGNPERSYPFAATGPEFPGTFNNYFASVLYQWVAKVDPQLTALTNNLREVGLATAITAEKISDAHIKISVSLAKGKRDPEWTELADVGFGVSQTLPVLVALLVARPGQMVYLEDPESHLHPRAQVALAGIIAQASKRGVRVVVETHSSLLILGIQTLVAEGKLDPELVKLHWFELNKGITKVSSADLDEAGRFGEWPEDFDDVSLNAQGAYLDAVGSLNAKLRAAAH